MESFYYQLNDAKMFADVTEGTAIIIDSLTGIYYGMNGFGTCIFENLQAGVSTGDILDTVKAIPDAPQELDALFECFINSLVEFEIIIPGVGNSEATPAINPEIAKADAFTPVCTEYQDVQDLLYADPIHEVDIEEGWTPE